MSLKKVTSIFPVVIGHFSFYYLFTFFNKYIYIRKKRKEIEKKGGIYVFSVKRNEDLRFLPKKVISWN